MLQLDNRGMFRYLVNAIEKRNINLHMYPHSLYSILQVSRAKRVMEDHAKAWLSLFSTKLVCTRCASHTCLVNVSAASVTLYRTHLDRNPVTDPLPPVKLLVTVHPQSRRTSTQARSTTSTAQPHTAPARRPAPAHSACPSHSSSRPSPPHP